MTERTTPYDGECNCQPGDARMVAVPVQGEWFVRDGKVLPIAETDLTDSNSDYYTYSMWVAREDAEDDVR